MSWTPISNTPPQYEENGIASKWVLYKVLRGWNDYTNRYGY